MIPALVSAQETEPFMPAEMLADDGGPVLVTVEWTYSGSSVLRHFVEPVAVLVNISNYVAGGNAMTSPCIEQAARFCRLTSHIFGSAGVTTVGVQAPILAAFGRSSARKCPYWHV